MEIECTDALSFLKSCKISPKLILTDPPYGMNYKTNIPGDAQWNKSGKTIGVFDVLANDEELIDLADIFTECYRILKDNGSMFVFCNDKSLREWSKQAEDAGFKWKDTLYWNKRCVNGGDIKWPFSQVVEMILCLTKGKPKSYKMYNKKGEEKKRILSLFDIGRVPRSEYCGHPTQKPLFICEQIIRGMTRKNDLVLDPFCGSGTSLVAAKRLGREFAGCDLEQKFVSIAKKRIANEKELSETDMLNYYYERGNIEGKIEISTKRKKRRQNIFAK